MISLLYPSVLSFIVGFIVGIKYREKIRNKLLIIILSIVIAYFLGSFPYYNLPISFSYVSAVLGVIFGNMVRK
ncbi:hypothetical protein J422_01490 [Methanocaldococcus villosus KIN24-T80]|uniref:Energy-converting hydrogenase B subunit J n=1 Tax=Methanocaldococcus villosus KIN24-T80 TaxID=1069083 RepID=N6UWB4_9EURY|nr:hypothetical protein [Methanocaldococcus villosus]ENN96594.1 hypothetical protein J422_01490 [Methanocaldococcus villosus KIN24-T80]